MSRALTIVKEEKGPFVPIAQGDTWAQHNEFTTGECPTSTHSKKRHMATATERQTITITWGDGRRSRSYADKCKCQFCGHEWLQEWMPA